MPHGDAFHSLRCDCRAQLEIALREVSAAGRGLILCEHQEGRGIGLMNKLRAYELQDQGADTVETNEQLGFENDLRSYALPSAVLQHMGITAVRLMSNNPDKVQALENAGIRVAARVPCIAEPVESRRGIVHFPEGIASGMQHWPRPATPPIKAILTGKMDEETASIFGPHSSVPGHPGTWGPFTLIEKIGEGGFGEVYRAHDPKTRAPRRTQTASAPRRRGRTLITRTYSVKRVPWRVAATPV